MTASGLRQISVGFSGTREGMTIAQNETVERILHEIHPAEVHHGCCVGADYHFVTSANAMLGRPRIYGHPSDLRDMTSEPALRLCDELSQPRPPLDRNLDIVAACDILLAAPLGMIEERRSGTWAAVRAARRVGKAITIIFPDGTTKQEHEERSLWQDRRAME